LRAAAASGTLKEPRARRKSRRINAEVTLGPEWLTEPFSGPESGKICRVVPAELAFRPSLRLAVFT
jgi:hypothetical protein